jgi:hypothetical protein
MDKDRTLNTLSYHKATEPTRRVWDLRPAATTKQWDSRAREDELFPFVLRVVRRRMQQMARKSEDVAAAPEVARRITRVLVGKGGGTSRQLGAPH